MLPLTSARDGQSQPRRLPNLATFDLHVAHYLKYLSLITSVQCQTVCLEICRINAELTGFDQTVEGNQGQCVWKRHLWMLHWGQKAVRPLSYPDLWTFLEVMMFGCPCIKMSTCWLHQSTRMIWSCLSKCEEKWNSIKTVWLAFSDVPMSGKNDSRDFIYPQNRSFESPEIWNYDYPITGYGTVCMADDSDKAWGMLFESEAWPLPFRVK